MILSGEPEDPPVIFVGVWNQERKLMNTQSDFGMFYIWDVLDGTYWSWDKEGVANIRLEILDDYKISFEKEYIPKGDERGIKFNYIGRSSDGQTYRGHWESKQVLSGDFILARCSGDLSAVQRRFGELEMKYLTNKIKEKRNEFSSSPLWIALER